MGKLGRTIWKIILLLAFLPLVKTFYDVFTEPVTGLFIVAGMDTNTLAIMTAIPWVFPLGVIVMLIIDLTKPDEPDQPSGFGGIKFPK
jgi:hypothetical protein